MYADLTISSLSLEYVQVPVQAIVSGTPYSPVGDTVQMAFVPVLGTSSYPQAWYAAAWDTTVQGTFVAECLVGPSGTVALTPGTYAVWLKITDSPEVPVKPAGTLTVT